jgi:hydroxymethylglutaryl-CoA synthase
MVGIASYGAYIPFHRLKRDEIARVWGKDPSLGEKAVANWDEDSLTMGVEAAIDCTQWQDLDLIDGLYFASTTPPYREKGTASLLAAVLGLGKELFTADFTDSLRAGTAALRAAVDAIKAGSAKNVMVVTSDCRQPAVNSEFELVLGDGAAAFLLSNSDVAVSLEGSYSSCSEFIDIWKREGDSFIHTWEERFVATHGYLTIVEDAVSSLMKRYSLAPKDFAKLVLYGHNPRRHREMAQRLGFDISTQVEDPMFTRVGNTGAAFAPMMLVSALEKAKPGDRLLLVSYGDGCDAYILQVSDQIEKIRDRRGIARHLESSMMLPSYGKYLSFRNLVEWEASPETAEADYSSLTQLWRDSKQVLQLIGLRCQCCGRLQIDFPVQRICSWCQAKDQFEEVRLADKKGTIFTFAVDERASEPDRPRVQCVVDFEEGARLTTTLADFDREKIEIGMPVEPVFRKLHGGQSLHNYFWKVRPVRC